MTEEQAWTLEAVQSLGTTTSLEEAASILGIGRTKAYELAQQGDFPAKVIRVGRRYRVSVPALLRLLVDD
ncbi:helix-turn-helix domain-containing protein [Cryptosporangium aurantiacum]|uniref:DNA binding domain-containing protein, excisionase family n=1 Tax=Cryptosporangium aurantiacum TaxID=134849 RepID=A0A1M7PQR6_9ACTN|nr:helix-turn-helix domain-containing protein [Cryptosporangium aurantiacum]SHN19795.1 DNA binding domain-containing protein, excisionase family [Cryptosporangium aurantiacum]